MTSAVFVFLRTIVLNYEVGSNINGKLCLLSNSSKLGEKQKLQVLHILIQLLSICYCHLLLQQTFSFIWQKIFVFDKCHLKLLYSTIIQYSQKPKPLEKSWYKREIYVKLGHNLSAKCNTFLPGCIPICNRRGTTTY